jgi:hypothetical protein
MKRGTSGFRMAQQSDRVIDVLATELRRRPALGEAFLRQLAVSIDGDLRTLSERPFRVLYVFPARQRAAELAHADGGSGRRRGRPRTTGGRKPARKRNGTEPAKTSAGENGRNGTGYARVREAAARASGTDAAQTRAREPAPARPGAARRRGTARAVPAQTSAEVGTTQRLDRARVRAALLAFAGDIAAAEAPGELVAAIGAVDRHIDQAMASSGS